MIRTYSFRLYPTVAQEARLEDVLRLQCDLYNVALEQRRDAWKRCGKSVGLYAQQLELKTLDGYKGLKRVSEHTLRRLDRAFKRFFKGGGYPRFRSVKRFQSFETDATTATATHVRVIGFTMRWRPWREVPDRASIRLCRIVRKADGWYASIVCEVSAEPLAPTRRSVGVDVGMLSLVATSDGVVVANPRHLKAAEARLRKAQRRVSRRKKGSRRREKARVLLAKQHLRLARTRAHFLHGISKGLVRDYDVIAMEALSSGCGTRSRGNRKAKADAAWGTLRNQVAYKAESAGRVLALVDPKGTSQKCSACGAVVRKALDVRVHSCACGLTLDRDVNAARNVLKRALLARRGGAAAVGAPRGSEKSATTRMSDHSPGIAECVRPR